MVWIAIYIEKTNKALEEYSQKSKNQRRERELEAKKWFTWGDSYELQIADEEMESLMVALVVAIDCAKAAQNVAVASG